MKKLILFLLVVCLSACKANPQTVVPTELVPAEITLNAPTQTKSLIYIKDNNTYKSFMPFSGIALTGSSRYTSPLEYNQHFEEDFFAMEIAGDAPLPFTHILQCLSLNKTAFITVNASYDTRPSYTHLLALAKDIGKLNIPITINLFPLNSSFYNHKQLYTSYWCTTASFFNAYAPNATLVCSLPSRNASFAMDFLPNSQYLSHIGVSHFQNAEDETTLIDALNYICLSRPKYPIIITALGISHYNTDGHAYKLAEAATTMEKIYTSLSNFPQVKGVIYSDKDLSLASPQNTNANNYQVTTDEALFSSYKKEVAKYTSTENSGFYKLPLEGLICENKAYVPESILDYNTLFSGSKIQRFKYNRDFISADYLNNATIEVFGTAIYITIN